MNKALFSLSRSSFFLTFMSQHERTALMYASYHGHTDIVKLLLKAGADTDLSNRVRNISMRARVHLHL